MVPGFLHLGLKSLLFPPLHLFHEPWSHFQSTCLLTMQTVWKEESCVVINRDETNQVWSPSVQDPIAVACWSSIVHPIHGIMEKQYYSAAHEKKCLHFTSEHNIQNQLHLLQKLFHITGREVNCLQKLSTVEEISNDFNFQSSAISYWDCVHIVSMDHGAKLAKLSKYSGNVLGIVQCIILVSLLINVTMVSKQNSPEQYSVTKAPIPLPGWYCLIALFTPYLQLLQTWYNM